MQIGYYSYLSVPLTSGHLSWIIEWVSSAWLPHQEYWLNVSTVVSSALLVWQLVSGVLSQYLYHRFLTYFCVTLKYIPSSETSFVAFSQQLNRWCVLGSTRNRLHHMGNLAESTCTCVYGNNSLCFCVHQDQDNAKIQIIPWSIYLDVDDVIAK